MGKAKRIVWTQEMDERAIKRRELGVSYRRIAAELGVSETAVIARFMALGIARKLPNTRRIRHLSLEKNGQTTQRKCLRCRKDFPSTWVGNRLCQNCNHEAARLAPVAMGVFG